MSRSDVPAEPAMEMTGRERPPSETDARSALFETFSRFSEAFADVPDDELEREIAKAQAEVRAERRGELQRLIAEAGVDFSCRPNRGQGLSKARSRPSRMRSSPNSNSAA